MHTITRRTARIKFKNATKKLKYKTKFPSSALVQKKPKLILTDKLVVFDAICGDYFREYDDKVLLLAKNITNTLRYIMLKYNYTFTNGYQIQKYMVKPLINKIQLDYNPIAPESYYVYNEIFKKNRLNTELRILDTTILAIGTDYSSIEYLTRIAGQPGYKLATYIAVNCHPNELVSEKQRILHQMINQNIDAEIITTTDDIYKLLEYDKLSPVDIYTYDNIQYVKHFELMFSHTHTISNIIGIISGLKYTRIGGTFIIHMQSIINKTNADLYLLAKQYFKTADLYMPECANPFKQKGTWAIFTEFLGIPRAEMDYLLENIVSQVKKYYPRGIHDSQVYDPHFLKLCWKSGKYFSTSDTKIPYITGFFNDYKVNRLDGANTPPGTHPVYDEIIRFNNIIYKRKLDFCNSVLEAREKIKYPEHYDLPTQIQVNNSITYLKKWGIDYELIKQNSTLDKYKGFANQKPSTYLFITDNIPKDIIEKHFTLRGNWKEYDDKTYKTPVDFLYIDGKYIDNKEYYKIKSKLKNLVGDTKHSIVYKHNLYTNLLKIPGARKFLPNTITFSIRDTKPEFLYKFKQYFMAGKPYICKVVKGGGGRGIIITDKFGEFFKFMGTYYHRMNQQGKEFKQYDWVIQEYIVNPWLVDGKKCHLRQLMIYQPGSKNSYYMYLGEFALAEKKYTRGNWYDKQIHDTHFHNGIGYEWPYDMNFTMEQWKTVKKQFDFIYACIMEVMSGTGVCYSDSQNCFEIFGLDFMITDDLKVILIEVNARVGLSPSHWFISTLISSLLHYVIDDYFPPKYSIKSVPINFIGHSDIRFIPISNRAAQNIDTNRNITNKYFI